MDTEYERCNFSRTNAIDSGGGVMVGVDIFPGDNTPRPFTRCNMMNVAIHPEWTIVKCNTTIREADFVDAADDFEIVLPSATILRTEKPHDLVHGRYVQGGAIEYKPTPERQDQRRRRRD